MHCTDSKSINLVTLLTIEYTPYGRQPDKTFLENMDHELKCPYFSIDVKSVAMGTFQRRTYAMIVDFYISNIAVDEYNSI